MNYQAEARETNDLNSRLTRKSNTEHVEIKTNKTNTQTHIILPSLECFLPLELLFLPLECVFLPSGCFLPLEQTNEQPTKKTQIKQTTRGARFL